MFARMLQKMEGMGNEIKGINSKMDTNAKETKEEIKNGMKEEMRKMRGEMQQIGRGLQAGIKVIVCSETWTARKKKATPRAGTSELKGSAPAGEDRVIRETCWARSVKVTVTVTQGEKLVGVTETCTSETRREVTELTETR